MDRLQNAYKFFKNMFLKEHFLNGVVLIPIKAGY